MTAAVTPIKDTLLLLFAAIASAAVAWFLWSHLGDTAALTLLMFALLSVAADNLRLRRKLRSMSEGARPPDS